MSTPENEYSYAQEIVDEEEEKPRGHFRLLRTAVLVAFAVLALQLGRIQIVQGGYYRDEANQNRFRLVQTDALRGIIYDRVGRILVRNIPSFSVSIVPADLPDDQQERIFRDLSSLLNVPIDTVIENTSTDPVGRYPPDIDRSVTPPQRKLGLREIVAQGRRDPYAPALVATNVPREVAFFLEERHLDYPGVQVNLKPVRQYVDGALLSHILGYTGMIPAEDLSSYLDQGYAGSDEVGIAGLEYTFEPDLHGTKGRRYIEVDVAGREVANLGEEPSTPGHNLVLNIDSELQKAAEAALEKTMRDAKATQEAVAIAIDPRNGQIRAMVDIPSYDDNLFATGISTDDYLKLAQDPLHPLINHAITGQYPPGSTFKLIDASAGLQEHVIDVNTRITTPGIMWLENQYYPGDLALAQPFYDWYKPGFGSLTIRDALRVSSDVFFYKLVGGYKDFENPLGEDRLAAYARLFGLGDLTHIDLPGEAKGLIPDPTWKRKTIGEVWTLGDSYNMAIGQGYVLATPLQVADYTEVVANGGTLYKPQLVYAVTDADGHTVRTIEPQVIRKLPIDPQVLALVREGMRSSVTSGTSTKANLADIAVAAKTGTAEYYGPKINGNLPTHAWFTAFAPYENPQIVVTVFVYGGGEGSVVAAPAATDILKAYFNLPTDAHVNPGPSIGSTLQPGATTPANPPSGPARKYVGRLVGVDSWIEEQPGIFGTVIDSNGRGVSGARVAADKCDGNTVKTANTDGNGAFSFNNLNWKEASRWCLHTVSPGDSDPFAVDLAPNQRFTIQFVPTQ